MAAARDFSRVILNEKKIYESVTNGIIDSPLSQICGRLLRAIARGKNIAEREERVKITKKKTHIHSHTHTHTHIYVYHKIKEGGGKTRTVVKL